MHSPSLLRSVAFSCLCLLVHSLVLVSGDQFNGTSMYSNIERYSLAFRDGSWTNWGVAKISNNDLSNYALLIEGPEGEVIEYKYDTYLGRDNIVQERLGHEPQMEYEWYGLLQPIVKVFLTFPDSLKGIDSLGKNFDESLVAAQEYFRPYWKDNVTIAQLLDDDSLVQHTRYLLSNDSILKTVRGASIFWIFKMIEFTKHIINVHPYSNMNLNLKPFLNAQTILQRCTYVAKWQESGDYCRRKIAQQIYNSFKGLRNELDFYITHYLAQLTWRESSSCRTAAANIRERVAYFMGNLTGMPFATSQSQDVCSVLGQYPEVQGLSSTSSYNRSESRYAHAYLSAGSISCPTSFLLSTASAVILFSFVTL